MVSTCSSQTGRSRIRETADTGSDRGLGAEWDVRVNAYFGDICLPDDASEKCHECKRRCASGRFSIAGLWAAADITGSKRVLSKRP